MADDARSFFQTLEDRVDPARIAGMNATYRFDLEGTGSWHVTVADGKLSVVESTEPADCVIRSTEKTLGKVVRGEQNAAAAVMLGRISIDGDMGLALKLQNLF